MALVNVPFCSQSMWRALELCNSWKGELQIRGNLWLSLSMISPTFWSSSRKRRVIWRKGQLVAFYPFFFFLEINTFAPNFVRLAIDPLPLPPLALRWLLLPRAAKAHCEFVLSSRTLFFVSLFCCMKVTYALQRHYCECSKGGCTFMTCTYSLQLSVLLVLLQHNRVPIFSVSAGESRKSDESCVRNSLEFFCETFALARRHSEEKALPPLSASASPCPRPTCWDLVGTVSLILTYKKQKAAEEKQ